MPLVFDVCGSNNLQGGDAKDAKVKPEALPSQVFRIQLNLFRYSEFVSAIDLSPTRQAGKKPMHLFLSPRYDEIVLIKQSRAWTNEAHVTFEDGPQLRQLIEAGLSQEATHWRQMVSRISKQMRCHDRSVDPHSPELRHPEKLVVAPDPL